MCKWYVGYRWMWSYTYQGREIYVWDIHYVKPHVFLKNVSQVFFVDDNINSGWKLVAHVNTRSKSVLYKR